ncbi:DUF6247 family protein [Nonomuraea rhizosphaerae]|uniref:DUF6247 family protein n=1 Tax=Nonomuraea rhizosphaerae TaxID=2665663 RepID=UPI001C6060D3|nr:DUF6247 family protein [Nonomuraea rhizosphaerae]
MTAQPAHSAEPDPEDILARLPQRERQRFLAEYRQAVDVAHEPWGYRKLRTFLAEWDLYALAASQPDYADRARAAMTGEGFITEAEAAGQVPGWPTSR